MQTRLLQLQSLNPDELACKNWQTKPCEMSARYLRNFFQAFVRSKQAQTSRKPAPGHYPPMFARKPLQPEVV